MTRIGEILAKDKALADRAAVAFESVVLADCEWRQVPGQPRRRAYTADGALVLGSFQTQCASCEDYFFDFERGEKALRYGLSGQAYCPGCVEQAGGALRPIQSRGGRVRIEVEVPDQYAAAKFADFKPLIRTTLHGWPFKLPFIFGVGPAGHGKSHAGWACVNELAAKGFRVTHGYVNEVKGRWAARDPFERERYGEVWKRAAYVVWDDLTSAAQSDGWGAFVHEVVDARLREKKPMLLLSTASVDAVGALLGESIRSRLNLFEWLNFVPNGDRRQRAGKAKEPQGARKEAAHPTDGYQDEVKALAEKSGLTRLPDGRFVKGNA